MHLVLQNIHKIHPLFVCFEMKQIFDNKKSHFEKNTVFSVGSHSGVLLNNTGYFRNISKIQT